MTVARRKKQWIDPDMPYQRHVKKGCERLAGVTPTELTGLRLEEHRARYGEAPSARCPVCWGTRQRAQLP